MISTVRSGLSGAVNTKRSVRSRRASSPGCLRLAALKWFDMVAPSEVCAWAVALRRGSAVEEAEQGGVDLGGVGPGDGVRAAFDHDELRVLDQGGEPFAGLGQGQDLVGVALDDEDGDVDLGQVVAEVGG